jgi:predicted ferric reductase
MLSLLIGILAFFFLTLPFLLTIRWRPLISFSGGIASFYRWHHYLGLFCFLPIFFHIFFQFQEFGYDAWEILFDFTDASLLFSWLGLVLIVVATGASFLKQLRFRLWKFIHLLLIPAYLFIIIHAYLFLPELPILRFILGFLILIGLFLILLNILSGFKSMHQQNFEVSELVDLGANIFVLNLIHKTLDRHALYPAGQIVYVRFEGSSFSRNWHPFSIASCQTDEKLRLIIKSFGNDTNQLRDLKQGNSVAVTGPFSEFKISGDIPQVWIAGGVGIAPFIGMIRCLEKKNYANVQLLYFANSIDDFKFLTELNEADKNFQSFTFHKIILPRGNFLNEKDLLDLMQEKEKKEYLICGPPGFMKRIRIFLKNNGIKKLNIHTEEFSEW